MSDDLELEIRMVVLSLELPKDLWRMLEIAEEASGTSISKHFAYIIKEGLLKMLQLVKAAACHQLN